MVKLVDVVFFFSLFVLFYFIFFLLCVCVCLSVCLCLEEIFWAPFIHSDKVPSFPTITLVGLGKP